VEDELVRRNPCTIRRAGAERPAERPIATIAQLSSLATAVTPRYRALVNLAAWTGLRYGELAGLQLGDLNLVDGTVHVERQLTELRDGSTVLGPPKTEASHRTVAIPPHVLGDLVAHLTTFVGVTPTSPSSRHLREPRCVGATSTDASGSPLAERLAWWTFDSTIFVTRTTPLPR
jgi:integrase